VRKLIVSNLVTLDGYYEGKDRNLTALFDYFHDDYAGDETFDHYNTERWRAADTLHAIQWDARRRKSNRPWPYLIGSRLNASPRVPKNRLPVTVTGSE